MHRPTALAAAAFAALAVVTGCTADPTAVGPPGRTPSAAATSSVGGTGVGGDPAGGTSSSGTKAGGHGAGRNGAGGTAAGGTATSAGSAGPVDSTRPVDIPANTTLRPSDWPGGIRRESTTGVAALARTEPSACQDATSYPSDRHRLAGRTISIFSDAPESGGLHQEIVRYAPGRATQALAEMRRVLVACHSYRTGQVSPPALRAHRLEAERFAGDDALLVRRSDRIDGAGTREWSDYFTMVRLGDAIITTTSERGEGTADRTVALRLARVGAARAACLRDRC